MRGSAFVSMLMAGCVCFAALNWAILADDKKEPAHSVTVELQGTLRITKLHAIGNEDGAIKKAKVGDRILLQYYYDPKVDSVKKVRFELYGKGPAAVEVVDIFGTGGGVGPLDGKGEPQVGKQYFGVLLKAVRPGKTDAGIVLAGLSKTVPLVFEIEE